MPEQAREQARAREQVLAQAGEPERGQALQLALVLVPLTLWPVW